MYPTDEALAGLGSTFVPGNGMDKTLIAVAEAVSRGTWSIYDIRYNVGYNIFQHRVEYPQAGTTGSLEFFNTGPTKFISNWPAANGLPNDTFAWCFGLSFGLETSHDVNGTAQAGGVEIAASAAGAPFTLAEAKRAILRNGWVSMSIGDQPVFQSIHGLDNFPEGSGADVTLGGSGGTVAVFGGIVNNGAPYNAVRGMAFRPMKALQPGKPIKLSVEFQSALALPASVKGVLKASLHTIYIRRSSN